MKIREIDHSETAKTRALTFLGGELPKKALKMLNFHTWEGQKVLKMLNPRNWGGHGPPLI